MSIINLCTRFGQRHRIAFEESYYAQYGAGARVDDPHYKIIPGARGHVFAWDEKTLAASTNTSGSTATKLRSLPGVTLWQDGTDGITVLFDPGLFEQVATLLGLRRRRQVSDEERKRLAELGHRHGFKPNQHGFQDDLTGHSRDGTRPDDPEHQYPCQAIQERV
ncbi:MAG TPA: hypothetical protein DD670_06655 [Planctomycetaceae bacterium]|nr:hypothetical protein [Planctomycetaceae bacterium]